MSAAHALLEGLIDHAPLFPPASLPLEEALEDHRRALASPHAWMVARFVCPASRVGELGSGFAYISEALDLERFTMFTFSPIEQRLDIEIHRCDRYDCGTLFVRTGIQ